MKDSIQEKLEKFAKSVDKMEATAKEARSMAEKAQQTAKELLEMKEAEKEKIG